LYRNFYGEESEITSNRKTIPKLTLSVTVQIVEYQYQFNYFEHLFITLDDNAEYGLNIRESVELKQLVSKYNLESVTNIYPGADEVGFTMLGRTTANYFNYSPVFCLIFRDPTTIYYIPNYEGQPMIETIQDQINAAGGTILNDTCDIYFLVNNFSEKKQIEAPYQPLNRTIAEYDMFIPYLSKGKVIGFADNRYSNGADIIFVNWMETMRDNGDLDMSNFGYAGWNTDGNTLGTVIGNSVLLYLFKNTALPNKYFNTLRILEDCQYQALLRQELINYVEHVSGDDINNLATDLEFYER
jgi:hypothetical protein